MKKNKKTLKPVDAPSYGYWSALIMSFYSKRLYIDVGKRWSGIGLLYLLLVVALLAIPYSIKMSIEFNNDFQEHFLEPIKKLPTIYIQNGEAAFDKPMPYFIKNEKGQVIIIIDTTGTVTEFTEKYPKLTLLINKEQMAFRLPAPSMMNLVDDDNRGPVIVQPFSSEMNMVFDGESIINNNSIYGLKYSAQLLMYPIVVAIFYSMLVVFFLVFAFLGQVFSTIFFSFKLGFKASCRLFMVASTPMLLLLITFLTLNIIFPGFGFILLILLIGYFSFAIYSLRSESLQMVSQ